MYFHPKTLKVKEITYDLNHDLILLLKPKDKVSV
jgi:hypothetical protein